MAAPGPQGGGRALAFVAGAVFVVVAAAVIYLVFGLGAQTRRVHLAVNTPPMRSIQPRGHPAPAPGPAR